MSGRADAGRRRASLAPRPRARACVDGDREPRLGPRALRALSRQAHRDPQLQYLLMITLHYVATATGLKIAIALEEMALDYAVIDYPMVEGQHLTAELRPIYPNFTLPVHLDHSTYFREEPVTVIHQGSTL